MTRWALLLRGINVGGKHIVPMAKLRELLSGLGFVNVSTYIQSGNCVFNVSDMGARQIAENVEDAIETAFGFKPSALALSMDDLRAALDDNPYKVEDDEQKFVHLSFLLETATDPNLEALESLRAHSEQFCLKGRVFYLHAPDGIGRSKLVAKIEKNLGVAATARNLRTVIKISELF